MTGDSCRGEVAGMIHLAERKKKPASQVGGGQERKINALTLLSSASFDTAHDKMLAHGTI